MQPNAWHDLRVRLASKGFCIFPGSATTPGQHRPTSAAAGGRSGRTQGISLRHGAPSSRDVRTRRCVFDAAVADATTFAGIPDVWRWPHASPAGLCRGRWRGERTRIAETDAVSNLRAGWPGDLYLSIAAESAGR